MRSAAWEQVGGKLGVKAVMVGLLQLLAWTCLVGSGERGWCIAHCVHQYAWCNRFAGVVCVRWVLCRKPNHKDDSPEAHLQLRCTTRTAQGWRALPLACAPAASAPELTPTMPLAARCRTLQNASHHSDLSQRQCRVRDRVFLRQACAGGPVGLPAALPALLARGCKATAPASQSLLSAWSPAQMERCQNTAVPLSALVLFKRASFKLN